MTANQEIPIKKTYRVEGFSCAGCASTFEKNVQNIDGVTDAKVNFGASKITIHGDVPLREIEKAGSFESLIIKDEKNYEKTEETSYIKKYWKLLISVVFIVAAFTLQYQFGEGSILSVGAFFLAIIISGFNLFKTGLKNLIAFKFDMRTLMTVAIIGAAFIGEWGEGAIVVILFAISEALEAYSMDKARNSIRSLMEIAPKQALIRRNGHETVIDVEDIEIDDIMLVMPGQKIAMDGVVLNGVSTVNQAAITGESIPVEKNIEDQVFAGTLNEDGHLEVKVTKKVEDTTLSKIIHLVEEAQAEKAPSQAFVDQFAKYYTPAIIVIAFMVAIIPPLFFEAEWLTWVYQGLAVLVVGCPCALVISTPVAIVTAIGNAAKNGVLIKGGVYLEEMGQLNAIAFDKTGTLTAGTPVVTDFVLLSEEQLSEAKQWELISAMEYRSQHPLARAILFEATERGIEYKSIFIDDFKSITGKGIKATIEGHIYYFGSPLLFNDILTQEQIENIYQLQLKGKTVMVFGSENVVYSITAVADKIRENSSELLSTLHQNGITHTIMLTGDNEATAHAIGSELGIKEIQSELLPHQKLGFIKEQKARYGKVAMVGDGVNDAPALAAANIGIAMGGAGSDTALETADIALLSDDLRKLPYIVRLSRKALTIIKQNITFAIGIKLVALLLVVPGWLTLWIAIFADMGATLLVTLNGLRLLTERMKE
ncbi:Cd2+/Zn2+-exporting ATPase [Bacillus pakistanensis]|uniref:Cd(2+)-exporting ATPase n=1 Tax=Rossellomorea pakistanensis TaxID=992288 RepID=A0ABS2NET6_9BACI|nr:Cd2+/Zn2+-exporting ATPase [Bacillus pakistanensis]